MCVVLTRLTFAYSEIGHGWGSDHDPTGGVPYLMHPFALSGVEDSHRNFSTTSQMEIGRVLEVRRSCFQGNQKSQTCPHHWWTIAVPH